MIETKSGLASLRNRALPLLLVVFIFAAAWTLFVVYIQPLLDRAYIRKGRAAVFKVLTTEAGLTGSLTVNGEERQVDISFAEDDSDKPIPPSAPTFILKKYLFTIAITETYSPEVPPSLKRRIFVARGSFPNSAKVDSRENSIGYRLSWDGGECYLTRGPANSRKVEVSRCIIQNTAGNIDSLSVLERGEWVRLNSQRERDYNAALAARFKFNDEALEQWWVYFSKPGEFIGRMEAIGESLLEALGFKDAKSFRASFREKGEIPILNLATMKAELSLPGKRHPEQEPPCFIFEEKETERPAKYEFAVLGKPTGNVSGTHTILHNGINLSHKVILTVMTDEELRAEHLAEMRRLQLIEDQRKAAQAKIERRQNATVLLNRRFGFKAIWLFASGDKSVGVFKQMNIAASEIGQYTYELTFTQYGRQVLRFEGGWQDIGTDKEAIVLRMVRGGYDEKLAKATIRLQNFDFGKRSIAGKWETFTIAPTEDLMNSINRVMGGGGEGGTGSGRSSSQIQLIGE